jgi:hypothetical protein
VTSAEDAEHTGRPPTSKTDENVDSVKERVLKNRTVTICDTVHMQVISYMSVQRILKDHLNMCQLAVNKLAPPPPRSDKRANHINTCPNLQDRPEKDQNSFQIQSQVMRHEDTATR